MNITELKKARLEKGLRISDIAEGAQIALMTYYRYEAGKRKPDVNTARQISKIIGVDVNVLFPLPEETKKIHSNAITY